MIYETILVAITLVVIFYILGKRKSRFSKHDHNWKKAKTIHKKLNGFDGDHVSSRIFTYLRKIDPFVFEELLLYSFQQKGFKIIRNKRYTGDGGIDGKLISPAGHKILIQAKRYTNHINQQDVITFKNVVTSDSWASLGFFVHTGKTGKGSWEQMQDPNIKIISGQKLIKLIINDKTH